MSQSGFNLDAQFDVLAYQTRQHLTHLGHHGVQVDHLGLQDLHAAESQQLPGQPRGPIRRLLDLFDFAIVPIVGSQAVQQQFSVAPDDHQQIVEVMRHSAREASHRLHLLRLAKLMLQQALFGHVLGNQFVTGGACCVPNRPAAQPHGDGRAVLALPPDLHADEPFGMFLEDSGALARITIDIVVQIDRQQLGLRAVAQHLHQGRIDVEQFAISADSANAVRRSLHQRSVVRLRAPQRLLGPLPLGDIARHR